MQTGCRGTVARTRYVVVLVMATADTSCANPVFNPGIDTRCNAFLPIRRSAPPASSRGDGGAARPGEALRRWRAGGSAGVRAHHRGHRGPLPASVIARPAARSSSRPTREPEEHAAVAQLRLAAAAAGVEAPHRHEPQRRARASRLLPDSDGDGIPDAQEGLYGTSPTERDSDFDGLSDGVECAWASSPRPTAACRRSSPLQPGNDQDGDRLNDLRGARAGHRRVHLRHRRRRLPSWRSCSAAPTAHRDDLADDDRDGTTNVAEIIAHSDPSPTISPSSTSTAPATR